MLRGLLAAVACKMGLALPGSGEPIRHTLPNAALELEHIAGRHTFGFFPIRRKTFEEIGKCRKGGAERTDPQDEPAGRADCRKNGDSAANYKPVSFGDDSV